MTISIREIQGGYLNKLSDQFEAVVCVEKLLCCRAPPLGNNLKDIYLRYTVAA